VVDDDVWRSVAKKENGDTVPCFFPTIWVATTPKRVRAKAQGH
jgi:hypothetical protein